MLFSHSFENGIIQYCLSWGRGKFGAPRLRRTASSCGAGRGTNANVHPGSLNPRLTSTAACPCPSSLSTHLPPLLGSSCVAAAHLNSLLFLLISWPICTPQFLPGRSPGAFLAPLRSSDIAHHGVGFKSGPGHAQAAPGQIYAAGRQQCTLVD